MSWSVLLAQPLFTVRRSGRFLVADLVVPHRVLSTSVRNGGQVDHVRHLVNHQSCEGTAHHDRHSEMMAAGQEGYHDRVCEEIGIPPESAAVMGTAANMNYAAISTEADEGVSVTAIVTAGVEGNATAAGEPASWRETAAGMQKAPLLGGTINTMLVVNRPLTAATLARAVMTMTEGKSAALQRLAIPSRTHVDLATGTGTDQFCLAAPIAVEGELPLTSASPHVKLGELLGLAARTATMEAIRWQNGLEMSYTRGVFHALGRFGVKEATFFEDIASWLDDPRLELLKKNAKAALYEPLVGAAAHALAAVCDRVRHGMLPASVAPDAMAQQAAMLAANLAAQPQRWPEFRIRLLPEAAGDPKRLVLAAIALGWSEKWRSA